MKRNFLYILVFISVNTYGQNTILKGTAFCMFNRYVDGLGTWAPADRQVYINRGKQRAEEGYANFNPFKK